MEGQGSASGRCCSGNRLGRRTVNVSHPAHAQSWWEGLSPDLAVHPLLPRLTTTVLAPRDSR